MANENIITGKTEDEVWQQVEVDLATDDVLEYTASINQNGRIVALDIDIDLGGGFEGGYEITTISANLGHLNDFRFAMHHQSFIDEVGKFLGMEDVVVGFPEFDEQLIIKTNDQLRVKAIFADESTRQIFQQLDDFTLGIVHHHAEESDEKIPFLELTIELGITDPAYLRRLYHAFCNVMVAIEETEG